MTRPNMILLCLDWEWWKNFKPPQTLRTLALKLQRRRMEGLYPGTDPHSLSFTRNGKLSTLKKC